MSGPGGFAARGARSAWRRAQRTRDRWWAVRAVRRADAALAPPPGSAYAEFGSRSVVVPPARIEQPEQIEIGAGVVLLENAWLLARSPSGVAIRIGDRTVVNRFVKIVALSSVTIGPGVIIGDHAYISDVEYEPGPVDVAPPDRPLSEPAAVVIGAGASLGVGVVVKPGVTIGEGAYIGAASVVERDVPPRSLAVGNPARVVRRYDPDRDSW